MPSFASRVARRYLAKRLFQSMSLADAYKVLGVTPGASPEEIQHAYKKKVVEHHPDLGGSTEKMTEVNVAKAILDGKEQPDRGTSGYGAPETSYAPTPQPYKHDPVKNVITFADAHSKGHVPSGVTWKFRTDPAYGGYGDKSITACVFYGQGENNHVFTGVYHYRDLGNPYTNREDDLWHIWTETYPLSHGLDKLAPRVIREMFTNFEDLRKGYNAKVQLLNDSFKLDEKCFHGNAGRSMAFKDAMVQLGVVGEDSPWAKRKLSVVMILGNRGSILDDDKKTVTFVINGKEFPLSPTSSELIRKNSRILESVYGTYYYWTGDKKDLTRSKNGKMVMKWLAEKLTGEPPELIEMLQRASEQK